MNLSQLRSQMDRRTGKSCDVPAANAYINEAINIINNERTWPWMEAVHTIVIDGSTDYDTPTDYAETQAIIVNGSEARRIYIADGDTYFTTFDDITEDWQYSVTSTSKLVFYPTPPVGFNIVHRYFRTEPLLSQDLSSPLMPEAYHSLICDLASAFFLERISPSRADMYRANYERGQKKMYEAVERSTQPQRIRIRPGFPF